MKRPLSRLEKLLLFVPIAGALLAWQWKPLVRASYQMFPRSTLPYSSDVESGGFSPNGEFVFATSYAGGGPRINSTTSVWETKTGFRLWRYSSGYRTWAVDFSQDSKLISRVDFGSIARSGRHFNTPDSRVLIFEARTGKIVRSFKKRGIYQAVFVDSGRKLWCDGSPTLLLDARTGKTLLSLPVETILSSDNYISSDQKTAAVMRDTTVKKVDYQQAEIWNLSAARRVRHFPAKRWRGSRNYVLSPDGRNMIVWASHKKNDVEFWGVRTGKRTRVLRQRIVTDVRFSFDSRKILISELLKTPDSKSNTVRLSMHDVRTGKEIWRRREPTDKDFSVTWMQDLRFMPNGKRLVMDGWRGIFFLDAHTGKILTDAPRFSGSNPIASSDNERLVIKSDALQIKRLPNEWQE